MSGQPTFPGIAVSAPGDLQHHIDSQRWERLWLWASERVNPIVVKEVRQSLKSKQFTVSFGLTLIAAVGWTLIAISMMVPRIFYMPAGVPLLSWLLLYLGRSVDGHHSFGRLFVADQQKPKTVRLNCSAFRPCRRSRSSTGKWHRPACRFCCIYQPWHRPLY